MHRPDIDDLLEKYVNGTCTSQERQRIDLWLLKRGHDEKVQVEIGNADSVKQQLLAKIHVVDSISPYPQDADQGLPILVRIRCYKKYIPLSAVAALVLIFLALPRRSEIQRANGVVTVQTREVTTAAENPTAFKIATIDRDYSIDDLPENVELHIGNAYVVKRGANNLHYRTDGMETDELSYHTVSVPAGKDLNLYLADGSKVWVNTKTVLRFPTSRVKKERMLYLSGEAFFEVASDKAHPFIVAGKGMEVRATGTQFNVRNYLDEEQLSTTLVEGKVDVHAGPSVAKLSPNQQWMAKTGTSARVRHVDVAHVLGSKDGYFVFDKQNIREIMNEVSRWYDIEVDYQGEITDKEFGGTFSRKRSLDELIDYLSALGGFYMKREGRRITIMS
jgi:transmembrane sensor